MITAKEARELAESKPFINMAELHTRIENRAKSGYDFTWIEEYRVSEEHQSKLLELGYIVTEDITHSFKISW